MQGKAHFRNFLNCPDIVPDTRFVWLFREFWEVLNSQLERIGKEVRERQVKEVTSEGFA